jgi:hypothetical protein
MTCWLGFDGVKISICSPEKLDVLPKPRMRHEGLADNAKILRNCGYVIMVHLGEKMGWRLAPSIAFCAASGTTFYHIILGQE